MITGAIFSSSSMTSKMYIINSPPSPEQVVDEGRENPAPLISEPTTDSIKVAADRALQPRLYQFPGVVKGGGAKK